MNSLYLSIFLLLSIIAATTNASFQREDPLSELLRDITHFVSSRVIINDNLDCQEATYNLLQDTPLGQLMSEFFDVLLEMDLERFLMNLYPGEYIQNKSITSNQNLTEFSAWMEEKKQNTTLEDINNMREELEDLEAQWDSCLSN